MSTILHCTKLVPLAPVVLYEHISESSASAERPGPCTGIIIDFVADRNAYLLPLATGCNAGMQISCNDAAPVRIPTYEAGFHDAPRGGTPMGTPPSAKGIAAELPFAAGNLLQQQQSKE